MFPLILFCITKKKTPLALSKEQKKKKDKPFIVNAAICCYLPKKLNIVGHLQATVIQQ